jgi:hypothetical protein
VVGLHFRGDWLGFDGIADGRYGCDAIALDTGEVWAVGYTELLAAGAHTPELLRLLHAAMSRQIGRGCDCLLSLGTLPADARVADFIRDWAQSLAGARPAHGPDHTAHDACRDRQLPGHDTRNGEPRIAQAGGVRGDPLRREGLPRPDDSSVAALNSFIRGALEQGNPTRLPAAA